MSSPVPYSQALCRSLLPCASRGILAPGCGTVDRRGAPRPARPLTPDGRGCSGKGPGRAQPLTLTVFLTTFWCLLGVLAYISFMTWVCGRFPDNTERNLASPCRIHKQSWVSLSPVLGPFPPQRHIGEVPNVSALKPRSVGSAWKGVHRRVWGLHAAGPPGAGSRTVTIRGSKRQEEGC